MTLPAEFTCGGCGQVRTDLAVANDLGYFCADCETEGLRVTRSPSGRIRPSVTKPLPGPTGRPRLHATDAERQSAYRERKAEAARKAASRPGPKPTHKDNAARQRAYRLRKWVRQLEERKQKRAHEQEERTDDT